MPVTKTYKWYGSYVAPMTGIDDTAPITITGISKADPPVVTAAAHGLVDGDVVFLDGIVGMTELNEQLYIVEELSASTFSLKGIDSTDYTTYASGGTADKATFANFCECTAWNRTGGTSAEIDADSLCEPAKTFVLDKPDYGSTQLSYKLSPGTVTQDALDAYYASGDMTAVKRRLPNNDRLDVQLGYVQQTSDTGGNGAIWMGTTTIRNTGAPQRFVVA